MYNDSLPNVALYFLLEGRLEAMLSYKSHILQQGQKITLYGNNSDHIVQRCLNWDHVTRFGAIFANMGKGLGLVISIYCRYR